MTVQVFEGNGQEVVREKQIHDGTTYHEDTPLGVIQLLEQSRKSDHSIRLKLIYGDHDTGKAWGDVERCYIGRSTGQVKVPLVIYRRNSSGGGQVLDHCIVRIETTVGSTPLWTHADYHVPADLQWNIHG